MIFDIMIQLIFTKSNVKRLWNIDVNFGRISLGKFMLQLYFNFDVRAKDPSD